MGLYIQVIVNLKTLNEYKLKGGEKMSPNNNIVGLNDSFWPET